jgi:hypothetical protein
MDSMDMDGQGKMNMARHADSEQLSQKQQANDP